MTRRATGAAAMLAVLLQAAPLAAQDAANDAAADPGEVRQEIAEAMDAIGAYGAEQRDEAVATLGSALESIDAEIARREEALRDGWADMSETARAEARQALADLRAARNELGERYGALQSGADASWDALTDGVAEAWSGLQRAWSEGD